MGILFGCLWACRPPPRCGAVSGGCRKPAYLDINFAFASAAAKNRKVRGIAADPVDKRIPVRPGAERQGGRYFLSFRQELLHSLVLILILQRDRRLNA